eukprot:c16928_g1_i1 orf=482-2650(-)
MAMEQVEEWGREEQKSCKMDGGWEINQGWENSSPGRVYPTCSWRPWSDTDIFTGDVELSGNAWGKTSESSESPKDGWGDLEDSYRDVEEPGEAEGDRKCSGLTNLGNTCFMNSVLQCLTYTVPFANRITSAQHERSCEIQGFCGMCAVENHIKRVFSAAGSNVSPAYLARNLCQISRSFVPGQQQDAHEFLFLLMEGMQKCCKSDGSCPTQAVDNSFVSDIFMGQMKSQVKCKSCSHCSDSVEPFLGLNLEIENCDSIDEALSNFLAVEELQEENKICCSQCNKAASRSKQLSFSKSPQVLVIQLKRYKASEIFPTKIERDVKYEMFLDLMPFISKGDHADSVQEGDWKYKLYAVLVHSGWSTSSGHYYCYVQTSPGIWHCMNDSLVSRASEWTVLNQEAYILFYIREGIKEELHFENTLLAEPNLEFPESPRFQTLETPVDPYLSYPSAKGDSTLDNSSLLDMEVEDRVIPSQAVSTKPLESSNLVPVEVEVEPLPIDCSQVKSPGLPKQVVVERDSNTTVQAQQTSKNSLSTSKGGSLLLSLSKGGSIHEPEEQKHLSREKGHSSLKVERKTSPSPLGGTKAVLDSFENGSQHSFLRLLNKMPSTRRQALLASAISGQEVMKQSSPKTKNSKDKPKPANAIKQTNSCQVGTEETTTSLLQKAAQDIKEKLSSREKPWTEDYDHIDSRKLQRVGGKRVMASYRNSGVHHQQIHGVARANIV